MINHACKKYEVQVSVHLALLIFYIERSNQMSQQQYMFRRPKMLIFIIVLSKAFFMEIIMICDHAEIILPFEKIGFS